MSAFSANHIAAVDANRTVKDLLVAALNRSSNRRRISVTDLVDPRQSYFKRTRTDIEIPMERRQAMMAGTGFHELFGRAVSTEEYVEQLVEFEGIVGKIDIFDDAPLELKTSSSIPYDPLETRSAHVEQLAMYCVMTARQIGYLLYYKRAEYGRPPRLGAFAVEVTDANAIAAEMRNRRDLFAAALAANDPSALPRCDWLEVNCTYAAVCGCVSAQPRPRAVSPATVRVTENQALAQDLTERIVVLPAPVLGRISLNDLVFPRKAALRLAKGEGAEDDEAADRLEWMQRRGFLDVLTDAVWYGIPGASRRLKATLGAISASVLLFQEVPTLIRNSNRKEMFNRNRLAVDAPYYTDRLAFECALVGIDRGRIILYYSILDDKIMVYDIWLKDLDAVRAEMQRRLDLLEAGTHPSELPPCEPDWMAKICEYGDACACRGTRL